MAINIALAGNPNCGKTTMFNDLTGANQYVGNWPGVTVEKKEGRYRADKGVVVTDLPGVYSLSPYTPEEIVTRDYLMSGKPDAVINLVDATNLERNLYLTTQIIDLGIPTVVALNMMDLVEKNGDKIDVDALAKRLGCPVVPTSALKGRGMEEVVKAAIEAGKKGAAPATTLRFTNEVEEALAQVIDVAGAAIKGRHARWYAIKLLEGEQLTIDALNLPAAALSKIAAIRERLEDAEDDDAESIITNERYDNITAVSYTHLDVYKRQVQGRAGSYQRYCGRLSFAPTLFGLGLKDEVFGVSLPRLVHEVDLTVDAYRPGVLL